MKNVKILFYTMLVLAIVLTTACTNQQTESTKDSISNTSEISDNSILSTLSDSTGYYSNVFGNGNITTVNIDITEEDWEDLCANAIEEEYYPVDITVNGYTVSNVGFRAKGASSLRSVAESDSNRYGFKVKFDEYVNDQTLDGLDMMVLNGNFSDPSYMREYLAYSAAKYIDCTTPFVSYTKLYINGEYFGLYLTIEAYKDSFVERLTDDENAVLYKADAENCTLLPSDDASGFDVDYGYDDGNSNIQNLIEILNNTTAENTVELENILEVDSVLKSTALNTVIGNYDSYSGSKAHNYYLLYSDGKFEYISWDYNMAFGGFTDDGGASVLVKLEEPFYNTNADNRPLMSKLLEIDKYYEKYLSYVEELKEFFSNYEDKINTIADFIRDDVETDPTAFYTIEEFENNIIESNTDLSELQPRSGSMQTKQGSQTSELPISPKGGQTPVVPENGEITDTPQMPPNVELEQNSERVDAPQGGQHHNNNGTLGGGMIKNNTISIYDYIKQRLEAITF